MPFSASAPRVTAEERERELEKLSPEQIERASLDMAGTTPAVEETSDMIQTKREALLQALADIPVEQKEAYNMALEQCPDHARRRSFQLLFLRATRFDATAAADRMVQYWTEKRKVFGDENTFHPLVLATDLTAAELEAALRAGGLVVLPGTDQAGRAVLYMDQTKWDHSGAVGRTRMLKALWYLVHVALQKQESVSKRGLTLLIYNGPTFALRQFDRKLTTVLFHLLRHVLPIRLTNVRHVSRSRVANIIQPFLFYGMGPELRARYKYYSSSTNAPSTTCRVLSHDVGLEKEQLPVELGGTFSFDYLAWLAERERMEAPQR
jgi:hypothetical protein